MTAAAIRPTTTGRHRAPETGEARWATAADFLAAWRRAGRHSAPQQPDGLRSAGDDADPFDWLGVPPAAN